MDYTLNCIDPGQVRAIEDAALADPSMQTFVQDMITRLTATSAQPRYGVYRGVFDIYSEALVCLLLRVRTGGRLTITKIPETKLAGPDFECSLDVETNGKTETLAFFIEVKSRDIVQSPTSFLPKRPSSRNTYRHFRLAAPWESSKAMALARSPIRQSERKAVDRQPT